MTMTSTPPHTQTSQPGRPANRRQARTFVLVWMALTLLMGACAFAALYFSGGNANLTREAAAPTATSVPATATLLPTIAPATATPDDGGSGAAPIATVAPPTEESAPPTATPTTLPREDPSFGYGIQVQENYDLQDYYYELVTDRLGLNWVKQQIRWEVMEPEQGEIDFSVLDLVVPAAANHNLKLMLSVVTAPEWARPSGVPADKSSPPADFRDYADFLTAVLDRYPGQIHAIEVWNEMNIDREWYDPQYGISAERYVELLGVAERAIHGVDSGVIVISGALSPTGWNDETARDDFRYFDELIAAGLLNYADCVGAHHNGYNVPPLARWDDLESLGPQPTNFNGPWTNQHHSWSFRSTLEYYYNAIVAAGGTQRLCITEFGWPTSEGVDGAPEGFEFALDNTLEEQAEYIVTAYEWLAEWEGAWIAYLWNLNYSPMAGGDPNNDNVPYSILAPDGSPRPAFEAVAAMPKE